MTLVERLRESTDAIVNRWREDILATYAKDSSAAFRRQKDPFANPVGNSIREGTSGIFEALLNGQDAEKIDRCLQEIIRIRAVQEHSAAEAVGFVFRLKAAIRAELGQTAADARISAELAEFEQRIDQMALAAFEIFVQCRERLCELRVNEVKRRVSWIAEKLNQRGLGPEADPAGEG